MHLLFYLLIFISSFPVTRFRSLSLSLSFYLSGYFLIPSRNTADSLPTIYDRNSSQTCFKVTIIRFVELFELYQALDIRGMVKWTIYNLNEDLYIAILCVHDFANVSSAPYMSTIGTNDCFEFEHAWMMRRMFRVGNRFEFEQWINGRQRSATMRNEDTYITSSKDPYPFRIFALHQPNYCRIFVLTTRINSSIILLALAIRNRVISSPIRGVPFEKA